VSDQSTLLGPKFFVLGVWEQPGSTMAAWKARGVNTLVGAPQGQDILTWAKSADAAGFYQIREPSSNLTFDANDPYLLAWATRDEPSNTTTTLSYGAVNENPAAVLAEATPLRAAAAAAGKVIPIWTNHVAAHIYPDWAQKNVLMMDYMEGPESDWLSSDGYPIQQHQAFVVATNDGYTSTTQGIALDRQEAWSGGKPVMAFIGVAAYNATAGVPTAGQFNAMAWSSVIHGATGISYFSIDLAPFKWDATPPALVEAITTFDQQIAAIDKILINETSGGRDPFTLYRAANVGAAPQTGQLPYPFEAAEIPTAQGVYRIILNLSDHAQVLNKPEWGLNNVTFEAYGVVRGYGTGDNTATAPTGGMLATGTAANDTVIGGAGDDTINGASAAVPSYLRGGEGNDVMTGGPGFNDMHGNEGNDTLQGGGGENWVVGGKGDDLLLGGGAVNLILGNIGNDTLSGGSRGDILRGGRDNDSIVGGVGADFISGDRGDDTESGGLGADVFHGSQDAGIDRILDFRLSDGDRVQLDPGTTYAVSQVGSDTVIDMGGGNQMILVGVQLSALHTGWIA